MIDARGVAWRIYVALGMEDYCPKSRSIVCFELARIDVIARVLQKALDESGSAAGNTEVKKIRDQTTTTAVSTRLSERKN